MSHKELRTWRRVKLTLVRERAEAPIVNGPDGAASLVRQLIGDDPREHFVAVYLDTRHRIIAVHTVAIGVVDATLVGGREVFGPAVMLAATSMVVAHNHPSGDPKPSAEDGLVTERLREAGKLLGVQLLDSLVIGSERYFSFATTGYHPLPT